MICLNGPAARCVATGDKIIIIAYADMTPEEAKTFEPKVVFVDDENQISRCTNYERHGRLEDMYEKDHVKRKNDSIGCDRKYCSL